MKQFYLEENIIDLQTITKRKNSKRVYIKVVVRKLGLKTEVFK